MKRLMPGDVLSYMGNISVVISTKYDADDPDLFTVKLFSAEDNKMCVLHSDVFTKFFLDESA